MFNYKYSLNNSIKYKLIYSRMLILVLALCMLTGCGNRPDSNGSMKSQDGRSYGGLIEGELGKTVNTVFFDLTVDSAKKCTTYQFQDGLYMADEGNTYLEVVVTITNTYDKDLPMSISDFTLDFSENDSSDPITGFGSTEIGNAEYMDNIYTLRQGESITKTILFTVADRAEYLLCYKEYYEDKFEGDSYEIKIIPEELEPAVTTEATTEAITDEASTEEAGADSAAPEAGGTDGEASATEESNKADDGSAEDAGIIEQ